MRAQLVSPLHSTPKLHRLWESRWHNLLRPMALLFQAASVGRRLLYDRALLRAHVPTLPAISVGGLEVGGVGKTPVVAWFLQALMAAGAHPGLLCRGYGRAHHALCVRARGAPAHADLVGDEAAMLVASGLDIPIAASPSRRRGAKALLGHACTCLVLDDAFSHRGFGRAFDVVVLRGEGPFGNGLMLPAGSLREPPSSLRRANVVWLHTRIGQHRCPSDKPTWWPSLCPQAQMVCSHAEFCGVFDVLGRRQALDGVPVAIATAVARPQDVHQTLLHAGAKICGFRFFSDHHRFCPNDAQALRHMMVRCGAKALVVTAKDAVKLAPLWGHPQALWVAQTKVKIDSGLPAMKALIKVVLSQTEKNVVV